MSNIYDLDSQRQAKLEALQDIANPEEPELPLKGGGGGGTSGPMVPLKDYVDIADAAIESRLGAKLDRLATARTIWSAVGTAVAAILGVLLAVLAFGGDRFDGGLSFASQRQEQLVRDVAQDAALSRIDNKLDLLIEEQREARRGPDKR